MLTILLVLPTGNLRGGASFSTCSLTEELSQYAGVRVIAAVPFARSKEVITRLRGKSIPTHVIPIPRITHHPFEHGIASATKHVGLRAARKGFSAYADAAIDRIITSEHVDIVHICDGVIDAGCRPAWRRGVPLVWHLRELVEIGLGDLYDSKRAAFANYAKATHGITVSNVLRDFYAQHVPTLPLTTVYNGIVPQSFFQVPSTPSPGTVPSQRHKARLLFLGGIQASKGVMEVLEGMSVLRKHIGPVFELDIFGLSLEKDRPTYDRLIDQLRLQDCVRYKGWAKVDMDFVASYDVQLMCSKSEAFGRVTAQAMCAHTAVVGANTGGTAELLAEGRGFLYEQGNCRSLAQAAELALCDLSARSAATSAAYAFARDSFSTELYARNVYEVYQKVLAGRSLP